MAERSAAEQVKALVEAAEREAQQSREAVERVAEHADELLRRVDELSADVAVLADGSIVIVHYAEKDLKADVLARRYTAAGAPLGTVIGEAARR